jgi:hypothetical protein
MSSYEAEQSFRNLVMYYQKALLYIEKGQKASNFFSDPQRKKLIKAGILEPFYVHRGRRLKLTEKAKYLLNFLMSRKSELPSFNPT